MKLLNTFGVFLWHLMERAMTPARDRYKDEESNLENIARISVQDKVREYQEKRARIKILHTYTPER